MSLDHWLNFFPLASRVFILFSLLECRLRIHTSGRETRERIFWSRLCVEVTRSSIATLPSSSSYPCFSVPGPRKWALRGPRYSRNNGNFFPHRSPAIRPLFSRFRGTWKCATLCTLKFLVDDEIFIPARAIFAKRYAISNIFDGKFDRINLIISLKSFLLSIFLFSS